VVLSTALRWSLRWELVNRALWAAHRVLGPRFVSLGVPLTVRGHGRPARHVRDEWAAPWSRARLRRGTDHLDRTAVDCARRALDSLACPVLLIWGRDDPFFPEAEPRRRAAELADARLLVLGECGHWSPLERPAAIARAVTDFSARRDT
jgi:pimeloyl-ACP methyl ester carboxylesterase